VAYRRFAANSFYQLLVKGAIIIVAVFFDMKKYARRA
jgi:methyl-galactoside transport system permease protein